MSIRWEQRRRRPLTHGLAAAALLAVALPITACSTPTAAANAPARSLVWSDEFDGPRGAPPDPDVWVVQRGAGGWGNAELQTYTSDAVMLDGEGNLTITATIDRESETPVYTSGRITSQGLSSFTYGRLEARIRIPVEQGLLPAFWMLGDSVEEIGWPRSGEIDIVELPHDATVSEHHLHGPGLCEPEEHAQLGSAFVHEEPLSLDYHVYAVDRSPGRIEISIDGRTMMTVTPEDFDGEWVFDEPFHMLFSLAIGGVWPGDPDETTPAVSVMAVDWIRLYQ